MIRRYTRPEMGAVWEDERRFSHWLRIEIAVAEAMARRGTVPEEAVRAIRASARFDVARIAEIESETRHDVIAFLECVEESVGPDARWLHLGLTSSDLLDTTLALQIREATALLAREGRALAGALREKALRYKDLVAIGRTHGIYAEPITYGIKFAAWKLEIERALRRVEEAAKEAAVGKLSGAVGTFAHNPPEIEEEVLSALDLRPEPIASQIVHRDRHAAYLAALALLGGSLEKMATEIRALQKSDVGEVEEPFRKKQKGSSAMPHKRNPIVCERIAGLARLLRGYALPAMENIALWHERDISHSSAERVILPDATILADYMLHRFTEVIRDLRIDEERVAENLCAARNGYGTQALLLALARKGLSRRDAYRLVQKRAHEALEEGTSLEELLVADEEVRAHLEEDEIRRAFGLDTHRKHVDYLLRRAGVLA
ncbi:MAG: adenylosuccinate lyase [Candidatus Eisenbacteria bacterium]|nr:adenylosuccinate lyase [Candidatus Eisenbacteria bacterium]